MMNDTIKSIWILILLISISGCSTLRHSKTLGDPLNAQIVGYHPLDPLPVRIQNSSDTISNESILRALPDETMRIAVGQFNTEGGLNFGTSNIGYQGNNYVITLDYIKFTTNSIGVTIKDSVYLLNEKKSDFFVPVYIGVGLRLTANVSVIKGSVDLGDLFAIGAAASAEKITGTLVLQTLGISGESISATIPFPSEINSNSIQNAILALGAIKAKIYDQKTFIKPRVVGVYNTIGGGTKTINAFITSLLKNDQVLDLTGY